MKLSKIQGLRPCAKNEGGCAQGEAAPKDAGGTTFGLCRGAVAVLTPKP